MAEFRKATGLPTATNMVATDWRQLTHSLALHSVDIPLADPHFWTMQGSVRVAQICKDFHLTWGSHSNNHLDISLAMFTHVGAAARANTPPLTRTGSGRKGSTASPGTLKIEGGEVRVPDKAGRDQLDFDRIEAAHQLYLEKGLGGRDDAIGMQYLVPIGNSITKSQHSSANRCSTVDLEPATGVGEVDAHRGTGDGGITGEDGWRCRRAPAGPGRRARRR